MTVGPEGGGRARYPRARRITSGAEILHLVRRGKRWRTDHLDVFQLASPASRSRVGLVVPRHRRSAVDRNRLKRRLREIARTEILPLLEGGGLALDVLIRARREAYEAGFVELREELTKWARSRLPQGRVSS